MVGFLINRSKNDSIQINLSLVLANFFYILCIDSVSAKDLGNGKELFEANCNACHINGKNIIIPEKNLQRITLEMNGISNEEAIVYQITNGKNGMPAFGGRLRQSEINEIASYVLYEFQ